jgi:hypothetical protein
MTLIAQMIGHGLQDIWGGENKQDKLMISSCLIEQTLISDLERRGEKHEDNTD